MEQNKNKPSQRIIFKHHFTFCLRLANAFHVFWYVRYHNAKQIITGNTERYSLGGLWWRKRAFCCFLYLPPSLFFSFACNRCFFEACAWNTNVILIFYHFAAFWSPVTAQDPPGGRYCADRTKSAPAPRTAHPTLHLPRPQETDIVNVDAFNTSAARVQITETVTLAETLGVLQKCLLVAKYIIQM